MSFPLELSKHDIYDFISYKHGLRDAAKGKNVLITGAGTGIGKAIARHYALAGASALILAGRRSEPIEAVKAGILEHSPSCQIICVPTDVTQQASVTNLFDEAAKAGKIDILINNAGATGDCIPIGLGDKDTWWNTYEVNIKGTYLVTTAYIQALGGEPGTIINVSSMGANVILPGFSSYATSKAALNRMTEFTDAEHKNITCICFHPGGIADTDLSSRGPAYFREYMVDEVDLSAGTAVYLSTPKAAFLGGRFINACWDMEELEKFEEKITTEDLLKMRMTGLA